MGMNSVNTNIDAMVALRSLNKTNDQLAASQKKVSTGFRVADAKDDGAAFAVGQKVRADISGLTSANEQLGGVKGILETTLGALTKVSETMVNLRATLVKLADDNIDASQRAQYNAQYTALVQQVTDFLVDATYNGKSLIGSGAIPATAISTVRNESGTVYNIGSFATASFIATAAPATAALAQTALGSNGNFATVMANLNNAMNQYGNNVRYVEGLISYNKEKVEALESGVGALLDADLAKESARMQSLQIRQQLGTNALSMANQSPQSLLGLFR